MSHSPPAGDRIVTDAEKIEASGHFAAPETRQYQWVQRYPTSEYTRLMRTHSSHIELDDETENTLLSEVAAAVDAAGGFIDIGYTTNLFMARPL